MKSQRIAVLGAGNAAHAVAGHLAYKGYAVNMFSRWDKELDPIREKGGIELEGHLAGLGKPALLTDHIGEALEGADIVMVIVPAFAHAYMAEVSAPFLRDGQVVLLQPGHFAGSLEFAHKLKEADCKADPLLAESASSLYSCRLWGPALVHVRTIKKQVAVAALPATRTQEVVQCLAEPFDGAYVRADDILTTGLGHSASHVYHVPVTLFSFARVERGEDWPFWQGVTPMIAHYLERMDDERVQLARKLNIEAISFKDFIAQSYGVVTDSLMESIHKGYSRGEGSRAPKDPGHRFITEDIPFNAVPIAALGAMLGVPMPATKAIIDTACILYETNFWKEGRTMEKLGLAGLQAGEIKQLVREGR
jgi:opine dehydrogenase